MNNNLNKMIQSYLKQQSGLKITPDKNIRYISMDESEDQCRFWNDTQAFGKYIKVVSGEAHEQ